jgi:tetratricopeptide (TPR) repeat protein
MSPFAHLLSCVVFLFIAQPLLFGQGRSARPSFPAELHGQVRLAQGDAPANNVLVKLESRGSGSGRAEQVVTDRTGKFAFPGLSPAQYVVTAHAAGFKDAQQIIDLQTASTDYVTLRLTEDRSTPPSAAVGSKVVNANVSAEAQKELDEGRAALLNEDVAESIAHFEKAVRIYPAFLEARLALGTAYMDLQKWEEAERALRLALTIDPSAANALFALGEIYRRQAKIIEAEKKLKEGLALDPHSARGHLALALVYWQIASAIKNQPEARADFENSYREVKQSVSLDPALAEARVLKGNLLLRAQRGAEALVEFEEYLKLNPKGQHSANVRELIKRIRAALQPTDPTRQP